MKKTFLLLSSFSFLFINVVAQNNLPPVYEIKTDTASVSFPDSCWQMLGDVSGNWTIDQVSQPPVSDKFHPDTDIADSSIKTYWIRLRLKNSMPHEAQVYFRGAYPFFFDLYLKKDGSWWHQKTGPFVPLSHRDGLKNSFRIPLTIDP